MIEWLTDPANEYANAWGVGALLFIYMVGLGFTVTVGKETRDRADNEKELIQGARILLASPVWPILWTFGILGGIGWLLWQVGRLAIQNINKPGQALGRLVTDATKTLPKEE